MPLTTPMPKDTAKIFSQKKYRSRSSQRQPLHHRWRRATDVPRACCGRAVACGATGQGFRAANGRGAGTVWGNGPAQPEPGKRYPVVFTAPATCRTCRRHTPYFREQNNLLVQKGYIVLDLDYRASAGYGRDWRTAIYRDMGHPELEDYLDGLDWLVDSKQGDRGRAGIYS
ncbi:prolyl oligopeptidase family serine peptidase [Pantoea ananatis]|uniref:prolyl oligopeptidase family serine peptidase n=1 Tax=Pantoea ananas TaxID=553 RepID=UPI0022212A16|nr:prolyl oligopeptidase family serine peptidase [Pantoea ananatis]